MMGSGSHRKTVMIVDDNSDVREALAEYLQEESPYLVFAAENGSSALHLLQSVTPNVILLDYHLGDMTGLQVIDLLRKLDAYRETLIVFISAHLPKEAFSRPYVWTLPKPFSLHDLDALLSQLLK